jgi:hypothetical protein
VHLFFFYFSHERSREHIDPKKSHDWVVDQIGDITHKVKTQQVVRIRGQ